MPMRLLDPTRRACFAHQLPPPPPPPPRRSAHRARPRPGNGAQVADVEVGAAQLLRLAREARDRYEGDPHGSPRSDPPGARASLTGRDDRIRRVVSESARL